MRDWNYIVRLRDEWERAETGDLSVADLAKIVADKLSQITRFGEVGEFDEDALPPWLEPRDAENLWDLIETFRYSGDDQSLDKNDFDSILSELYDWADDVGVWVETF